MTKGERKDLGEYHMLIRLATVSNLSFTHACAHRHAHKPMKYTLTSIIAGMFSLEVSTYRSTPRKRPSPVMYLLPATKEAKSHPPLPQNHAGTMHGSVWKKYNKTNTFMSLKRLTHLKTHTRIGTNYKKKAKQICSGLTDRQTPSYRVAYSQLKT